MTDGFSRQASKTAANICFPDALPAVRETITRTLQVSDPAMRAVVDHLLQENGKNFRASLLLASAAEPDGLVPPEAITAAAALEILHLATLIHDDVIDEAPMRRGRPSVQGRFGRKTAVLGGDYLFCICFSMIAAISTRYPEKYTDFARVMTQICVGELRQNQQNGNVDLGYVGYLRTIAGKTAALFSLAMYAGSVLGGDSEKDARLLGRVGFNIGMLFQLADDCLDYESTPDVLKKSVKHDLAEGVVTLPLILAFAAEPGLKEIMRGKVLTAAEINDISAAVFRSGGVDRSWQVAERYALKARKLLDRITDATKRDRLINILDGIETRIH